MDEIPEFVIEILGPVRLEKVTDVVWLQRRLKEECRAHAGLIERLRKARGMLREEREKTAALFGAIEELKKALE